MKDTVSILIEIAFGEMKEKIKAQQEIIDRQNQVLVKMDEKIGNLEYKIKMLESSRDDDDPSITEYKFGTQGGRAV